MGAGLLCTIRGMSICMSVCVCVCVWRGGCRSQGKGSVSRVYCTEPCEACANVFGVRAGACVCVRGACVCRCV